MKRIFILFGLITALLANNNPKLTIKISNIEKMQGEIKVGVFNTGTNFLKQGAAIKNYSIKVDKNTALLTITDLPKVEYQKSLMDFQIILNPECQLQNTKIVNLH